MQAIEEVRDHCKFVAGAAERYVGRAFPSVLSILIYAASYLDMRKRKMSGRKSGGAAALCAVAGLWIGVAFAVPNGTTNLATALRCTRTALWGGFDGKTCKVQPTVATDGKGIALMTFQELLLSGSDVFYGQ